MSVTAKSLSKSGARGKEIDAIIREQVNIIDDHLARHEKTWGRNVVAYDLPIYVPLPGLEKKDSQRLIYSALLRTYLKRGFEVKLLLTEKVSRLLLAWVTDLDAEEVEAMNAVIRGCLIDEKEIARFYDSGIVPAPQSISAVRRGDAPPAAEMRVGSRQVMRPRGGIDPPRSVAPARSNGGLNIANGSSSTNAELALLGAPQN